MGEKRSFISYIVHALARKQDKILQNTLCLLLSILNQNLIRQIQFELAIGDLASG